MSASTLNSAGMSSAKARPLIGIVDDDPIMGESLVQRLQLEGYQAIWWQSGEEALCYLPSTDCRVLVCDIRLPDLDGEQLFRRALPNLGATPVIFITAFGEIEQAVRLMQAGAGLRDQAVETEGCSTRSPPFALDRSSPATATPAGRH